MRQLHTVLTSCFVAASVLLIWSCGATAPAGGDEGVHRDGGGPPVDGGTTDTTAEDAGVLPDGGHADAGVTPSCQVEAPSGALTVATDRGLVRGQEDGETVAFLGIPFAAPPTGANRFLPPQPAACFEGVRDATAYGPRCLERTLTGGTAGDEDCLYLNVWTPGPVSAAAGRPVMVFIHGGANVLGSAYSPVGSGNLYDGKKLATTRDVVVVSVNYRLAAFGFLAHPELSSDSSVSSGNNAILDQIAALRWVQTNIEAFGGDPNHVMIFGESAGALNTCVLVASPMAAGLFSAALMQSGECTAPSRATAEAFGVTWAEAAGCSGAETAACLRALAPEKLLERPTPTLNPLTGWNLSFSANVDGAVLKQDPLKTIERGEHNRVPLVVGSNADETELFIPAYAVTNCLQYDALIGSLFPSHKAAVLEQYPCFSYPFARWAAVAVTTDALFTCPARRIARAAAKNQTAPVFRYFYTHGRAYGPLAPMRAFHAAELPFVFGTWGYEGYVATSGEQDLSAAMQGYWASLARAGDPNHDGAPAWPAYAATDERTLELDPTPKAVTDVRDAACDFWDAQVPSP